MIDQVEPSVVKIETTSNAQDLGLGSGFVVDSSGLIATNHHVIESADAARVIFPDGKKYPVKGVAAVDVDLDLVILKIEADKPLKALPLASEMPKKGDSVLALGAPKGLSFSATEGIVSAVRDGDELKEYGGETRPGTWIQTSASITSGNSGGPLFDRQGRVVGMNSFILTSGGDLGFALASNDIQPVVSSAAKKKAFSKLGEIDSRPEQKPVLSPELQQRLATVLQVLIDAKQARIEALEGYEENLMALADAIKAAKITAEPAKLETERVNYRQQLDNLRSLISAPLPLPNLDTGNLKTLEVGRFPDRQRFRVVQIWDRAEGLVLLADSTNLEMVIVKGMDTTDLVDGRPLRVDPELIFMVLGTYTYTTLLGSSKTVFVLECADSTALGMDLTPYLDLVERGVPDPMLDAEERTLMASNENARMRAEEERKRQEQLRKAKELERLLAEEAEMKAMLDAQEAQRQAAAAKKAEDERAATLIQEQKEKERKALTKFDQAKKLKDRGNLPTAKKYLQEIIRDNPGTDIAKRAELYLKRISSETP